MLACLLPLIPDSWCVTGRTISTLALGVEHEGKSAPNAPYSYFCLLPLASCLLPLALGVPPDSRFPIPDSLSP
ncbi:MAG: hypothetical protein F6K26_40120 [Moorea sp. SIO2I5]|nr:hypothetical protein [Moorena sp. SIO2I5]